MTAVKPGDTVRIHYTGTLSDGTPFDSSRGRDPLEVTVGSGQIIPGLDAALPGMAVGEEKSVTVPAEQAYGPADPEGLQPVPRQQIPDHIPLDIGTRLQMQDSTGKVSMVTVAQVDAQTVVLDTNHPLAGEDLTFDIEVVSVA